MRWPWRRRAAGGHLPPPPDTDGVPAWLSPGAYSVSDDTLARYGPELLDYINDPPTPTQRGAVDSAPFTPDRKTHP